MKNALPTMFSSGTNPQTRAARPLEYAAQLDLEMLGEWAVKLGLGGPVQDQLILCYDFDEKGARPVIQPGKPRRK